MSIEHSFVQSQKMVQSLYGYTQNDDTSDIVLLDAEKAKQEMQDRLQTRHEFKFNFWGWLFFA